MGKNDSKIASSPDAGSRVLLLLDESVDVRFRQLIVGHDVLTVDYMCWKGTKNGALLALAASDGFNAIITTDVCKSPL